MIDHITRSKGKLEKPHFTKTAH